MLKTQIKSFTYPQYSVRCLPLRPIWDSGWTRRNGLGVSSQVNSSPAILVRRWPFRGSGWAQVADRPVTPVRLTHSGSHRILQSQRILVESMTRLDSRGLFTNGFSWMVEMTFWDRSRLWRLRRPIKASLPTDLMALASKDRVLRCLGPWRWPACLQ